MRIAFICKRRYMSKDVIGDRYGRLYEIPRQLAQRGHDVLGCCLSYYPSEDGNWEHAMPSGRLRWESRYSGRLVFPGLVSHARRLLARLHAFEPDVIIGASDIPHVILGSWLAGRIGRPFVADLYDDFESFGLARLPGAVPAYRRAVSRADVVTCTSEALARMVRQDYGARGEVMALPSAVDLAAFHRMDRDACRRELGLPVDAVLIGTAGGLHANRGIGVLYEAFDLLLDAFPAMHLVLAGPVDRRLGIPRGPRVHYLGQLPHGKVAALFNALDVGVIYLRDTRFGRFCFPQKAYEMAACGLPVVAASVGAMPDLLAGAPECLYRPDDPGGLADAIRQQVLTSRAPVIEPSDWASLVSKLDAVLDRRVE